MFASNIASIDLSLASGIKLRQIKKSWTRLHPEYFFKMCNSVLRRNFLCLEGESVEKGLLPEE
jgi:hypothetical protein